MAFSFAEIWNHMGLAARLVALVLATMGLASLTVFFERLRTLWRSRSESMQFGKELQGHVRHEDVPRLIEAADKHAAGHLAQVVKFCLTTHQHAHDTRDVSGLSPAERTRREVVRYLEDVGTDLRRGLSVLASVGSVAPFVGLLGTVLGIISAFQGIASSGSGGLSSVSAGISEALIETALGLAVAIPAVLAFNYLTTIITNAEKALHGAAGQMLDAIEGWEEAELKGRRVA
jgi:biopolymer transport protein ExbB